MARKSGFVRRDNRMRRDTLWTGLKPIQDTMAAASTAVIISSLGPVELAMRPFTIVRTRGLFGITSDQSAASEEQELGYGHCVVSDQALAIGATAVPTPVTDITSDLWFVYEMVLQSLDVNTAVGFDARAKTVRYFDSKAMRKVEEGQDRVSVCETGPNSAGVLITSSFRFLIKLH